LSAGKILVSEVAGRVSQPDLIEFASKCASQPGLYFDTTHRQTAALRIAKEIAEAKGDFTVSFDSAGCLNGLAFLADLEFDSAIFGMRMGAIRPLYASGTATEQALAMAEIVSSVLLHARANGFHHLMARVPTSSYTAVHALEQSGFCTMGVQVTLAMKSALSNAGDQSSQGIAIRAFTETDLPFLQELSAEAYTESRLFADPHLPAEAVRHLHRLWVANDCHGRAAKVLVADFKGEPVGYIACLLHRVEEDKESYVGDIDLLAVSLTARGKGVGSALVAAAAQWFRPRTTFVMVKTQVSNFGAIALYQRAGFQLAQAHVTLHAKL